MRLNLDRQRQVVRMYQDKVPILHIARHYGVSHPSIIYILRRAGVYRPKHYRRKAT
jgi:transposase-like protein